MNIGEAAQASGVSAKMIRYYEDAGLLPKPGREANGYRSYEHTDVHRLRFVGRARELGFSLEKIGQLLLLWQDSKRPSRDVKKLANEHLADLERQIRRLQEMQHILRHLVDACDGDGRPHCPILEDLGAAH